MSGKQMEGDNQRRRSLARRARDRGQAPSEAGATLGSGKQPVHVDRARRAGPPTGGGRSRPAAERPSTARLNAVIGLDVALAHQVDAVIDEAGAGMSGT